MLDPHYRTLRGLVDLVRKDWVLFGHQFSLRHALYGRSTSEQSFVFTQFLDCTWQLQILFPTAFEFNEDALISLHVAALSGTFGTLAFSSAREARDAGVHDAAPCLWGWLLANRVRFTNTQYCPTKDPLIVPLDMQPRLWLRAYAPEMATNTLASDDIGPAEVGAGEKYEFEQDQLEGMGEEPKERVLEADRLGNYKEAVSTGDIHTDFDGIVDTQRTESEGQSDRHCRCYSSANLDDSSCNGDERNAPQDSA